MSWVEIGFIVSAVVALAAGFFAATFVMRRVAQEAFDTAQVKKLLLQGKIEKWNALRAVNSNWKPSLKGEKFDSLDLQGVDLRLADLSGASFRYSNLEEADFRGAILSGADFTEARLIRASFEDADLAKATMASAKVDRATISEQQILSIVEFPAPSSVMATVVDTITAELIKHLKAHPKELYSLKPRQFEELIAEILAAYGWEVKLTPASKDGGYDLFAVTKDISGVTTSWIIECKKYREDRPVGVDIVRGLFGVKMSLKTSMAMIATTSYFTKGAEAYKASRYDLELRDYEGILEWINEYRPNPDGRLYVKDNRLILPGEK